MHANLKSNAIFYIGVLVISALYGALLVLPLPKLIAFLNGVFIGSMCAVIVAFWPIIWNAMRGTTPYNRVRQMTLGFFLCWLAYCLIIISSIHLKTEGTPVNSTIIGATSRYFAIVAAWLQLTAPDFGLGIFHGRDRKVLYTSLVIGAVISAVLIYMQNNAIFA